MPASEVLHPRHSFQHLRPATCKQLLWSKQDWKYLWGCVGHSSSPSWWTLCQWCHHHCRKKEKKSESDTLMSGYKSLGKCSMQRRLKTNSPERHLTKGRTWAHTPTHTRIHILNYRNTHTCTNTRAQTHTNTHTYTHTKPVHACKWGGLQWPSTSSNTQEGSETRHCAVQNSWHNMEQYRKHTVWPVTYWTFEMT